MSTTTITRPIGKIGLNIDSVSVASVDYLMADQFRTNDTWLPFDAPQGQPARPPIQVDADGWPIEDFRVRGINTAPFDRSFRMTFNGQADLNVATGGKAFAEGRTGFYDSATNLTTIIITPQGYSNQLLFTFTNTRRNPGDAPGTGLTNLHLMWAKDPHGTTTLDADFNPIGTVINPFMIDAIAGTFDHIRFMDMLEANTIVELDWEWAYRRLPGDFFQGRSSVTTITKTSAGRAVALEYAIMLCNAANVDAWINIPDGSTPDFIKKTAQACLYGTNGVLPYTGPVGSTVTTDNPRPLTGVPEFAGLKPNLKLIVEWSNETWNFGTFSVGLRNLVRLRSRPTGQPFSFDNPASSRFSSNDINQCDHVLIQRVMVTRAVEMSDIFRSVYGDDAIHDRCQPIIACQSNASGDDEILEFLNGYWNNGYGDLVANPKPPNHYFTNLARAAYRLFNVSRGPQGDNINYGSRVADALARAPAGFVKDPNKTDTQNAIEAVYASGPVPADYSYPVLIAKSYGLPVIIYEGCLNHGDGSYIQDRDFCNAVNVDPRMEALTTSHLRTLFDSGIDSFCCYNSSGGNWRTWTTSYAPPRSRLRGIRNTSERQGNPYQGRVAIQDIASTDFPDTSQNRRAGQLIPLGLFNFAEPGYLRVGVTGYQTARGSGPTFALEIDGERAAVGKLPHSPDDLATQTFESAVAMVPAGVHAVGLRPIQPLYIGFNTKKKLTWQDPGPLGDTSSDSDTFTAIADNARLETAPGGVWAKTTTGSSLISDTSRGGVRPPIGTGGSVSFRYNRSQALTSAAVLVEATFDLKPDSDERSVSLASADGKVVLRGGLNGKTGFFTIDQPTGQGKLNDFSISGDGKSGTVRLGLSWNGTTARVLANGFTIREIPIPAAAPGIIAGVGMKATPTSDPATSTLIRSFRAVNQAVGAPVIVEPTGPAGGVGTQSVPGVAWLVRQLRHAV